MRRKVFFFGAITFSVTQVFSQVSNITSVAWDEVPPTVQQAVQSQTGGAVQKVERGWQSGQPVYSVALPQANGMTRVVLDASGTALIVQPPPSPLPVVAPMPENVAPTNELPEGVTMEIAGGRSVYNFASPNAEVQMTPDARVLSAAASTQVTTQAEKIPWEALPPVVQTAIHQQSAPGQIIDITRGTYYAQSVYEVVYVQDTEQTRLRLSENGDVLGQEVISTEDSRSVAMEPYIGAAYVPIAVSTTLRAAAGNQPIESVQQEVVDGNITYVGMFRENGQPVTLRISQTGQILQ